MHIRHGCNVPVHEGQAGQVAQLPHGLVFDGDAINPCFDGNVVGGDVLKAHSVDAMGLVVGVRHQHAIPALIAS